MMNMGSFMNMGISKQIIPSINNVSDGGEEGGYIWDTLYTNKNLN